MINQPHNKVVEILLVEDNSKDLELALYAFKKNNLANNIEIARDGEEALDFIFCRNRYSQRTSSNRPKVILLDLKLPKVDGLEVLRTLKNNDQTKCIPIVVLTSSKEEKDLIESYKLGVNSYMVKPIDFNKFAETVREIGYYWVLHNTVPFTNN